MRNHRVFRNDDDAVADEPIAVIAVRIFDAVFIDELDVIADAGVFNNNRAANNRIFTDADVRLIIAEVVLQFFERFKKICAHHD